MSGARRIMLKISGEALSGRGARGFDAEALRYCVGEIRAARDTGARVAVVVGGGNLVRGASLSPSGPLARYEADAMGMLGTLINALALAEACRAEGVAATALSAVDVPRYVETYHPRRAGALLDAGEVVVLAGGVGNPFFTTDTTGVLRAIELGCALVAKATKVDGVFDKDPAEHADAARFETITYDEVLERRLGVMDLTAIAMASEHAMALTVFDFFVAGATARVAKGEVVGTRVTP